MYAATTRLAPTMVVLSSSEMDLPLLSADAADWESCLKVAGSPLNLPGCRRVARGPRALTFGQGVLAELGMALSYAAFATVQSFIGKLQVRVTRLTFTTI